MRIELISTGDEVITGSIDDTNASYLSRELIEAGLQVDRRHTVGDNLHELMAVFSECAQRKCLVIVTGGMGPTNDDLTTEAAARVAKVPLELNELWLERMRSWFENRGRTMSKTNIKQAMLPQGAIFINNPVGTACGFLLKINAAIFIFCPGVPSELKAMWESYVKEMVLTFSENSVPRTHLIRLFLMGIGESNLAELLSDLTLPPSVTIGDRAIYPRIELKLIGHDATDSDMLALLEQVMRRVAPYYVCRDSYSLIDILAQKNIKLAPINAVDGLCQGWLLINLQQLCTNFVTCSVLNSKADSLDASARFDQQNLLEHTPIHNRITLLPFTGNEEAAGLPADRSNHYELHYQLLVYEGEGERMQERTISGNLIFSFKDDIFVQGSYRRNRDFLAQLCCCELYKALVREPWVTPEDCSITVLSCSDSMPVAPSF